MSILVTGELLSTVKFICGASGAAAGASGVVRGAGAVPGGRTRTLRTAWVPADSLAVATIRAVMSRSWVA
ncbi:hypothetical protein ACWCXE_33350 [Streptomyces sp. NPDC001780]